MKKKKENEEEALKQPACLWEGVSVGALEGVGSIRGAGAGGEVDGAEEGDRWSWRLGAKEGVGSFEVGVRAWDGGEEVRDGDLVGDGAGADPEAWARVEVASKVRSKRVTKVEEAIVVRKVCRLGFSN